MMDKKLLVSLFLGLVSLASGRITETEGESGPECGNNRRCVSTATCSEDHRNCICKNNLYGNAKLCCLDQSEGVAFLQSDPHLHNFFLEYLPIPTPCRYRLLKYSLPIENGYTCVIQVYADNYLYQGGQYYPNQVELRVDVQAVTWKRLAVLIQGDASNGTYRFTELRKKNSEGEWGDVTDDNGHIATVPIPTTYDKIDNLAKVVIDNCGLTVKFRPADSSSIHQTQVPGIVLVTDPSLVEKMEFSKRDLSSTIKGPSIRKQAEVRNVDIDIWTLYLTLENTETIDSLNPACDNANIDFLSFCRDEESKLNALQKCGGLYIDEPFIKCVADSGVDESFQPTVFSHCIRSVCTSDRDQCVLAKSLVRQETKCKLPKTLRKFNCQNLP